MYLLFDLLWPVQGMNDRDTHDIAYTRGALDVGFYMKHVLVTVSFSSNVS
jgi:hypothetical protein